MTRTASSSPNGTIRSVRSRATSSTISAVIDAIWRAAISGSSSTRTPWRSCVNSGSM
jgi:hypothetical protein